MQATEKQFYSDSQSFLDKLLEEWPVLATQLGDHRYDDQLGDRDQEALDRQRALVARAGEQFQSHVTEGWSLDGQIDRTLMIQLCKDLVRGYDKIRREYRDPGTVVSDCTAAIYLLVVRDFSPLPERLRSILGRLRQIPRALREGRSLVIPAEVPPIWAEIALESTQRSVGLFAGFIPSLAEAAPELKEEIVSAAQAAAAALQVHAVWIQESVLPQAAGEFAAGKELFDELLRENHMVDYDADELRATGWKLLEDTRRQMEALAAEMDPDKTASELLKESKKVHPTADGLLDAYRQKMDEARQFVIDHEIVSIPEGESIQVVPTPAFLRPIIPYAAYMMPGFLEEMQEGVFIVTPVDEEASPAAAESKLRGHPYADIPVTALHEAYPGHHLQLVFANTLDSMPRKFGGFLSTLFVEGWAFYCEELMEQLGFVDKPIQRLARLQAQMWRASRIVIDASLHCSGMTVEEAIRFLVEQADLEPDDAKAEVRRYTQTPTQPQSYLMGKLQIIEIINEYQRRNPETTMRQMHDAILSCGSLPPRLMRLRLFGPAGE